MGMLQATKHLACLTSSYSRPFGEGGWTQEMQSSSVQRTHSLALSMQIDRCDRLALHGLPTQQTIEARATCGVATHHTGDV